MSAIPLHTRHRMGRHQTSCSLHRSQPIDGRRGERRSNCSTVPRLCRAMGVRRHAHAQYLCVPRYPTRRYAGRGRPGRVRERSADTAYWMHRPARSVLGDPRQASWQRSRRPAEPIRPAVPWQDRERKPETSVVSARRDAARAPLKKRAQSC